MAGGEVGGVTALYRAYVPRSVGRQAETGLIPNEDPGRSSGPTAPCWAGGPHGPDGGGGPLGPTGGGGGGARDPCWCCRGLTKPLLVLFFTLGHVRTLGYFLIRYLTR